MLGHCRECRWFASDPVMGQCKRYPQTLTKHALDWCGEFDRLTLPVNVSAPDVNPQPAEPKRRGRPPKQP